jgi:hypothetical protein
MAVQKRKSSPSYDGASCLLTLHFLERDERLRALQERRALTRRR